MKKICFVSLYTYSLFNKTTTYVFGGSEVRSWLFGTGIAKNPLFNVAFVVFDHGQPAVEQVGNVRVYAHSYYTQMDQARGSGGKQSLFNGYVKTISRITDLLKMSIRFCYKNSLERLFNHSKPCPGTPGRIQKIVDNHLGSFIRNYWIPPEKWNVYCAIDADIYCVFGCSNLSAEIVDFCKREEKKCVLFISSDADLSETYSENSQHDNAYGSWDFLCAYTLRHADIIITQTREQSALLSDRFKRKSQVIANPIDLHHDMDTVHDRKVALWIGKSDMIKQPDLLVKLATSFPEVPFVMVMNPSNPEIFTQLVSGKPGNLEIIEQVPLDEIDALFRQAFVFINTSRFEGFPNTFLQAGKYGVPVLSLTVDPDHFIEQYQCGIVAHGSFDELVTGMKKILGPDSDQYSGNIRRYVTTYHNVDNKVMELSTALMEISDE